MLNPVALAKYNFGQNFQSYDRRDAIIYALGVGLGADPFDPGQLRFLDERALAVLPSYGTTLCSPTSWLLDPALGIDFTRLVHAAQWAEFLHPLSPAGECLGSARVVSLTDRGRDHGAVLVVERELRDVSHGQVCCRQRQTLLLRGDGGFGGAPAPRDAHFLPDRAPDHQCSVAVSQRAALIFRLSGDWNPLHFDPAAAHAAGFPRPILHGLASFGMAGFHVSRACGKDPAWISALGCRFSGVVMPGDTISFDIWVEADGTARFAAQTNGRQVLRDGLIRWREERRALPSSGDQTA